MTAKDATVLLAGALRVPVAIRAHVDGDWQRLEAGGAVEAADRALRLADRYETHLAPGNGRVPCLHVMVEGRGQADRLRRVRPLPAFVLQLGDAQRFIGLWPLRRSLSWDWGRKANVRLAYRVGAVQRRGDPDELSCPVPGSLLRVGRKRPVVVRAARVEVESFVARDVVGSLRDPPPQRDWRNER